MWTVDGTEAHLRNTIFYQWLTVECPVPRSTSYVAPPSVNSKMHRAIGAVTPSTSSFETLLDMVLDHEHAVAVRSLGDNP